MKMGRRKAPAKKLVLIAVILVAVLLFADNRMRPAINSISQTYAQNITSSAFNTAVESALSQNNTDYSALVTLQRDSSGKITAIQTDTAEMNRLRAEITSKVQEALGSGEYSNFSVPVGTFTGCDLLMGRGPKITFKLQFESGIKAEYESIFDSAGINQTRHRIMLKINSTVSLIAPWYNSSTQVQSDFLIAETVLVGSVPDAFMNITGAGIGEASSGAEQ